MSGSIFAASVAIVRRDDVLLIQRNRPPAEGLWTLPGGRLEAGETPEDCVSREVREEMGLSLFGLRRLSVLTHGQYRLQVFATQMFDGEITPDVTEVRAWRWVRLHQAEELESTPGLIPVLATAIRLFDRS